MVRYSTALSHIVLAGTSLYCLKILHIYKLHFAKLSYGLIALNSLLGIWRWGNPTYGYKIDKLYNFTSKIQDLLVFPGIVTTIWLKYHYSFELASAHIFVSLIPLLIYLYDSKKNKVIDSFLGSNVFSLFYISLMKENYYGLTTALSFTLNYFFIKRDILLYLPVEVPTQDLFNYSMCFFSIFALKAVQYPIY